MPSSIFIVLTALFSLAVSNKLQCYDCISYSNVEECRANISRTLMCEHTCLQASFRIEVPSMDPQKIYARGCGPDNGCNNLAKGYLSDVTDYNCSACFSDLCNDKPFEGIDKKSTSNELCIHYLFN
ncbi:uncharacterized protein LOC126734362 [Anthonomus grandis grandis]|uniref:uncharacterized protein LOC126734362 n=1 Tax=Anthonomus grandis grandis TaxID=2921223 RepID=UPI002166B700|nr:uncharacterized protein LOC126734362 [Anthonomus grandis grandis]